MNNLKRWLLVLLASGIVVILLIGVLTILPVLAQGPGGMMHGFGFNSGQSSGYGPGWMTGYTQVYTGTSSYGFGPGWMHRGYGPRGRFGWQDDTTLNGSSVEMPVTPTQAVEAAQTYLNSFVGNNLVADEHVEPFYGYYTLHVGREDETIGMLSVNGYTGHVFLHTWHGNLVTMSEE